MSTKSKAYTHMLISLWSFLTVTENPFVPILISSVRQSKKRTFRANKPTKSVSPFQHPFLYLFLYTLCSNMKENN